MSILAWLHDRLICVDCHKRPLSGHCSGCKRPLCLFCIDWPNSHLQAPGKGMCALCRAESTRQTQAYLRSHPVEFASGFRDETNEKATEHE